MIIIIILGALFLINLFLFIYFFVTDFGHSGWWSDYDGEKLVFGTLGMIFLFAVCICGAICLVEHNKYHMQVKEYELTEQITLFQNEKNILESYHVVNDGEKTTFTSDITFEVISTENYYAKVNDYNKKIYDFKINVKKNQYNLNNPWVNWFICPAYQSISDETLENLTYTLGK